MNKIASLYELTNDYSRLLELSDEEITEEEKVELQEIIYNEIVGKSLNSYYYIQNTKSEIEMIKEEIKRLQAYKKTKENALERFKNYVTTCLQVIGKSKIDFGIGSFGLRKSSSVNILDESKIPKKFIRKTIKLEPDKTAIKEAINNGLMVKGAEIQENQSLTVK